MEQSFKKMLDGCKAFQEKYASGNNSEMNRLATEGQKPEVMVIACCDSRVDPAVIFQCDPGDIFTVRNIANIIPSFEKSQEFPSVAAALEYGIRYLNVKHLVILGHSQCGGMDACLNGADDARDDFISQWLSCCDVDLNKVSSCDELSKASVLQSYENCLSFPWIKSCVDEGSLSIHRWFFDIKQGEVFEYSAEAGKYQALT